ncbi:MAG: hypothetical protein FWG08_01795 [Propionibacteriaceae bacterium]|nr:hypothetical protein [Propionibacteriaceae bacterium]
MGTSSIPMVVELNDQDMSAQLPAWLMTAKQLGDWLRSELACDPVDVNFMLRTIAHESDQWLKDSMLPGAVEEPASTGDQRWDALLEGVVAYRSHQKKLKQPQWTKRTSLEVGWNPRDDSETPQSVEYALMDTLDTPVEILDKGVTYSYRNMELL